MAEIESEEQVIEYTESREVSGFRVRDGLGITGCSNTLAYAVDEPDHEYILVQERAEGKDKAGYLEIPGGHQRYDGPEPEKTKETAFRELKEEALAEEEDLSPSDLKNLPRSTRIIQPTRNGCIVLN